jgi:hypothetical protein
MTNWTRADTRALIEAADERPCISVGVVRVIRRHHAEPGLVERMARLEDFCECTNSQPFVWGQSDCSLLIADWAVENGHPDPAASWRGSYSTEDSCRALIAERGDLRTVVAACALSIGLQPLYEPEFGSIAVIGSETNPDRQWSAIWNGRRWLVKWASGDAARWTPFAAKPLGIWRI